MSINETVTNREKNGTALLSVLAIIFLTLLKASVAILTGSLGLLAEAAHSLMDLVAAGVTFFAVRMSGRPADSSHTYGHGKYENLSALVEVILLLFACAGIIYEAVQRLFFITVQVQASPWSFLVMGIAVAVNIILSRRLRNVAKKYGSQALEAEGLDFFNDVWSSAVVILSLLLVMAADKFAIPWLAKADAIAGVVVAGLIANSVLRLGRRAVGELLDEVPENLQNEIMQAARLPGVEEVRQVRVRRSGNQYFADLTLAVSRSTSSENAHQITDLVEKAIQARLPTANVLVHIEPVKAEDEQLTEALHALGERFGLGVHHIHITEVNGRQILTVHLDVAEEMQLEEAHAQASAFEKAVSEAFPVFERVWTHLEPVQRQVNRPGEAAFYHDEKIEQLILELPHVLGVACEIHEITLLMEKDRLNITFHCKLHGDISIEEAHELSERMESALCDKIPSLETVLIHMEPLEQVE
ncbi:MAG: cation diffusion facilitator family transporter [Anaerolineales bacterium]|jgi:cation diffusion facilitator family transporter